MVETAAAIDSEFGRATISKPKADIVENVLLDTTDVVFSIDIL